MEHKDMVLELENPEEILNIYKGSDELPQVAIGQLTEVPENSDTVIVSVVVTVREHDSGGSFLIRCAEMVGAELSPHEGYKDFETRKDKMTLLEKKMNERKAELIEVFKKANFPVVQGVWVL
jgi:hypothetical protein